MRKDLIEKVKEHLVKHSQYGTVSNFIRYATIKQMNEDNIVKR